MNKATAQAHPNIAVVKYWGKRDLALNLPAVSSVSLTVSEYLSTTSVTWGSAKDQVFFQGSEASPEFSKRTLRFLDVLDSRRPPCLVQTHNNFPTAAGLASSSSGFAALALAGSKAANKTLSPQALSILARQGSGSACRSLFGGFVLWDQGSQDDGSDSYARELLAPQAWDLRMLVAVVNDEKKATGSTAGMLRSKNTSPYYEPWVSTSTDDVRAACAAIAARDLQALGAIMEHSTFKMHAVMQTSLPPLVYWQPNTVACIQAVWQLREQGIGAWLTMDAGPNVKVLCAPPDATAVQQALTPHAKSVAVLRPAQGARLTVGNKS